MFVVVSLFITTDRAMLLSSNWVNMAIPVAPGIHFPKRFVLNYNPLSASVSHYRGPLAVTFGLEIIIIILLSNS